MIVPFASKVPRMSLGLGIFLIVVGAILSFAVKKDFSGIDLTVVGYILMGAGVLVLILAVAIFMPRTRRSRSTAVTTDSLGRQYVTERDDRISGL